MRATIHAYLNSWAKQTGGVGVVLFGAVDKTNETMIVMYVLASGCSMVSDEKQCSREQTGLSREKHDSPAVDFLTRLINEVDKLDADLLQAIFYKWVCEALGST